MGPVEFLVISFPGSQFDGTVVPELDKLVSSGTVRILDLVFAMKDEDGTVTVFEHESIEGEAAAAWAALEGETGGLLNDDDIDALTEDLEPGSSGALLVWEDLWAEGFAAAVRRSGGEILAGGRVPRTVLEAALDHVATAQAD